MRTKQNSQSDRAATWLCSADLRPTRQRLALAELLIGDGRNRHVSAEWLYEAAVKTGASVSLATVYNTLHAFRDAGLLREVVVEGTTSWFDTRTDDHAHFYWEDTGELTDAPSQGLSLTEVPPLPEGTEIASVDVVIRLRRTGDQNH